MGCEYRLGLVAFDFLNRSPPIQKSRLGIKTLKSYREFAVRKDVILVEKIRPRKEEHQGERIARLHCISRWSLIAIGPDSSEIGSASIDHASAWAPPFEY